MFKVYLKAAHDKKGLSAYQVSKESGVHINTVKRYTDEDGVTTGALYTAVVQLIGYYGLDWRDSNVLEVIEDETKNENTLLATA